MSFILDALKKVDAKKRFGDDAAAGALARSVAARERRGRELFLIGAVAVGSAVVTAGALVFFWMQSSSASPRGPGESSPPAAAAPLPEPAPPPEIPASGTPAKREVAVEPPAPSVPVPTEIVDVPEMAEEGAEELVEDAPAPAVRLVGRPQPAAATSTAPSSPEPPPSAPPVERPNLVLQGTSVLDGRPVAVISDRRVFEGDFIEGVRVLRIDERSVTLELDGARFTLTF